MIITRLSFNRERDQSKQRCCINDPQFSLKSKNELFLGIVAERVTSCMNQMIEEVRSQSQAYEAE